MYLDDCVCVLPDLTWLPLLGVGRKSWYIIIRKKIWNQNDVEFDLSIGHALVLFPFFLIINKKCTVNHVRQPRTPQYSYTLICFGHKTLFSQNLMIIITGTFRNTLTIWNNPILHRFISLLPDVIPFTKAFSHNYGNEA